MAGGDASLLNVARSALLSGVKNDLDTVRYRQDIIQDSIKNPTVVRELYNVAAETIEIQRQHYFGIFTNYPGGILTLSSP
jgi:hypothetical protein